MAKSLTLGAALATIVLLMCAGSMPARSRRILLPYQGSAAQIEEVASTINALHVVAIWSGPLSNGGEDGNQYTNGNDKDDENVKIYNNNGNKGHKDVEPAPKSSTTLSFGAALLIGASVLYSRRMRRNRK